MVQNALVEDQEDLTTENEDLDSGENQDDEEEFKISKAEWDKQQKMLAETKELLKASTKEGQAQGWMDRIGEDKFEFIKLYNADRKMAEYVAGKFGDKRTAIQIVKDLKAEMNGEDVSDKISNRDDVEAMLEEREANATYKALIKEYKLDSKTNEKIKDAIIEEYEDLIDGKKMTSDNVDKYFRKAVRIVKRLDEKEAKLSLIDQELAGAGAMGNIKASNGSSKRDFFAQFEKGDHTSWY